MPDINKKYSGEGESKCASIEIDENMIGLNQFNTLNDFIQKEIESGIKNYSFDLTKLDTINSSGLGILISSLKKIKTSGGTLKIVNANEKILNIFKLTKLNNVFEFAQSS